MKKGFFILILVLAINVTAPAGNTLYQRQRHLIEYTQEVNNKNVTNDELLKNKTIMYIRYAVLENRVMIIDWSCRTYNNTS
jgi:hypothetical protein